MSTTASTLMSTKIISVAPETPVPEIARLLSLHEISAVPVIDGEGRLLGMVSEGDLMARFGAKHQLRRTWWLDMLAEGGTLAPEFVEYVEHDHRNARDVMTREVVTVTEDTELGEVSDLLLKHRIKRVPVLRGGKVVGIVSRADIIRHTAHAAAPV